MIVPFLKSNTRFNQTISQSKKNQGLKGIESKTLIRVKSSKNKQDPKHQNPSIDLLRKGRGWEGRVPWGAWPGIANKQDGWRRKSNEKGLMKRWEEQLWRRRGWEFCDASGHGRGEAGSSATRQGESREDLSVSLSSLARGGERKDFSLGFQDGGGEGCGMSVCGETRVGDEGVGTGSCEWI